MKSVVRPELPTAAAGPSQAPAAAVDNSAPRSTHPEPTYKSGKTVQRTGTTSVRCTVAKFRVSEKRAACRALCCRVQNPFTR
jgi:hypothetical protein